MIKKTEIFSAIAREMKGLGFKRRRSNYEYLMPLRPGFEGWCSFADSTRGDKAVLGIATFVGIRSEAIEGRIAAWCGDEVPGWDGRSYVSTVSVNAGYLTPQNQWLEHVVDLVEDSMESAIRANIADVTGIALGHFESYASFAGLAEILTAGGGQLLDRRIERIPLAFALQGNLDRAYQGLEGMRAKVEEGSFLTPRYLRFVEGFEAEFPPA